MREREERRGERRREHEGRKGETGRKWSKTEREGRREDRE